ncbi:MAG TPA: Calx-beta domain-containing protein, partial [Anaerolineae bacterium]|nr:Calx-beta domain-containing protein [Anaerolineae bacterium]
MPSQAGSIQSSTRSGAAPIIAMLLALALALTVTVLVLAATDNNLTSRLSIGDVSVVEGDGDGVEAVFTVTMSTAMTETVSVEYATADGTATAPADYTAIPTTTLFFAPGETARTITVTVHGDTLIETDETFFVNLANTRNATIAVGQGVGTITNDDALPSLSITDVSALEGNSSKSNVMFTVTLSAASDQQVTVGYASANGTATWPSDYFRIRPATLNFPPGTITQTITAEIKGDTLYESDETFFVNLFNATNATLADDQAVGTLLNDDPEPTVQFSAATYTVHEGAGSATITAALTGATEVTATVSFAT